MDSKTLHAFAQETLKKPRKAIKINIKEDEEVFLEDGSACKPMPVKTTSDALRASLLMLFKHVADVHMTVVEIIAEKYHLDIEEIHNAVTVDPRWTEMLVNPIITNLTTTELQPPAPVAPVAPAASPAPVPAPVAPAAAPVAAPVAAAAKKRGRPPMTAEQKALAKAKRSQKQPADEEELVFP